jgi:hypothetical protein
VKKNPVKLAKARANVRAYQSSEKGRLRSELRRKLRVILGHPIGHSFKLLVGCTVSEFREHIERQFQPGMTWQNYGSLWHLDHIRPLASFDLTQKEQQFASCHFTNLRPLWAQENMTRRDFECPPSPTNTEQPGPPN